MSNTSPEPDTQATPVEGNNESAEEHGDMHANAEGLMFESPQAKQAKAEALAHARAARAARAKYARLTSIQGDAGSRNPLNQMQTRSDSDMSAALDRRVNGVEWSLFATRLVDQAVYQARTLIPEGNVIRDPALAVVSNIPLVLLRQQRGSGVRGFVSDPKVWTFPAVAVLAVVGDLIKRKQLEAAKESEARKMDQVPVRSSGRNVPKVTGRDAGKDVENADLPAATSKK